MEYQGQSKSWIKRMAKRASILVVAIVAIALTGVGLLAPASATSSQANLQAAVTSGHATASQVAPALVQKAAPYIWESSGQAHLSASASKVLTEARDRPGCRSYRFLQCRAATHSKRFGSGRPTTGLCGAWSCLPMVLELPLALVRLGLLDE